MKYKTFSKEELTDLLTNGVPMPESALSDGNTIDFYFDELQSFINGAENEYEAKSTDYLEITILIDDLEFIILRYIHKKVYLYLANTRPDIIDTMTPQEASDVVGILYGVIVFNDKWIEVNELVDEFTEELINKLEYDATKEKVKMDANLLSKLDKYPKQEPDKTLNIKDYDNYYKKGKGKKYGWLDNCNIISFGFTICASRYYCFSCLENKISTYGSTG